MPLRRGLHCAILSLQFATRGPLDEYASEDEYREWSSEDEDSPEQVGCLNVLCVTACGASS
jgi:hypothetical protein